MKIVKLTNRLTVDKNRKVSASRSYGARSILNISVSGLLVMVTSGTPALAEETEDLNATIFEMTAEPIGHQDGDGLIGSQFAQIFQGVQIQSSQALQSEINISFSPLENTHDAPSIYYDSNPDVTFNITVVDEVEIAFVMFQGGGVNQSILIDPGLHKTALPVHATLESGMNHFIVMTTDVDGSVEKISFDVEYY